MRVGITGASEVSGENENGRSGVEFCAERGLCVGKIYFEHKNLHKYRRVARGQGGVQVKSMTDLVLVKKDMLHFVQDVRAMGGMGRGILDHPVVLCKVRLVGAWIKRREVVDRVRRIKSEKLREHQKREEYARSFEWKRVEWDGENNVEHMWEQVTWAMVESARKVCDSVRVRGGKSKSAWWNDEVKAAVKRKEDGWKELMGARDEDARERCLEVNKEEKRKVKRWCILPK